MHTKYAVLVMMSGPHSLYFSRFQEAPENRTGWKPFIHHVTTVWKDSELSMCLSSPADGCAIRINEPFGAKHKFYGHLARGTSNQVIHQIQNTE